MSDILTWYRDEAWWPPTREQLAFRASYGIALEQWAREFTAAYYREGAKLVVRTLRGIDRQTAVRLGKASM